MIKLVITDVDGTLLDNESTLPELNKQAITACREKGVGVILATGKSIAAIQSLIKILRLELPQITLGGAVIVNRRLEVINSVRILPKQFYKVIKTIKEKGYKPLIARSNGNILYDEYDPRYSVFKKINEPIFKVKKLEDPVFALDCVSISVTINESDPLDRFLRDKFSETMQLVRSGEYFFDVLSKQATKGNALSFICKNLNINKDEVAVFGDSPNDLSMFEFASLRIAPKNSYSEVLKKADFITEENFNSGFAKALYKYILF